MTHRPLRCLIYDIETSYLITKTWGIYESNAIGQGDGVVEDFQILCFAYKWLGERQTVCIGQPDFKSYRKGVNDDKNVVEALWALFNEADIVLGHNSDQFDNKKSQARMIYHGLPPVSPYQKIDTKKLAKRQFGFTSNKLNDLATFFKIGRKEDTGGHKLWDGCLAGDPKAWAKMIKYNKQDVILTEKIYLIMMGWAQGHPNLANIAGRPEACPKCLSEVGFIAMGYKYLTSGKKRRWQCKGCGSYVTGRLMEKLGERPVYV